DAPQHFLAGLAQRHNEGVDARVVAHGVPVLAARGAGAGLYPVAALLFDDVIAIMHLPRGLVDLVEDVLKNHLLVIEKSSGFAVELPEDASFARGKEQVLAADIDKDAFEDLIHVERFAGNMLEVPGELAVFGMKCNGRTGIECVATGATAGA